MTILVQFAEEKDAMGFEAALHERIREKVQFILDALRAKVAEDLFNENAIDTPGSPPEGGIAGVKTSDSGLPAVKSGVKFPGKTDGGSVPQGAGPDKLAGAIDPNSLDHKGSTNTPHPLPANETVAHANKDAPDQNRGAKDPNSSEFNRKGKVRIPANESKWLQAAVHPSRRGMFKGRGEASLEKELSHLRASGPHPQGSDAATREHQLAFAISRKQRHGA